MTLSGATIPGQSGPWSNGNEGVLCISQSPSITGTSPLDFFSVISVTLAVVGSYPSAEVQSVYSTTVLFQITRFSIKKKRTKTKQTQTTV